MLVHQITFMMMFGSACEHIMTSVTASSFFIQERMATFQLINKIQVAHLLWAIFVDTRAYFNTPHDIMGNPPVSSLDWLIGAMKGGSLPSVLGTPLNFLFGSTQALHHHHISEESRVF